MITVTKSFASATIAATALAGLSIAVAPSAGAADALAPKNFSKSFQQSCQVGQFGTQSLGAVVSGTTPAGVRRATAFKATNIKIKVTVPANLNTLAYSLGARSQQVTFKVVNLNNVNITPKTVDVVKTNIVTNKVPITSGQSTSFLAPKTGGLTAALKSGTKGTGVIKAGAVNATFQLFDANGQPLGGPQAVTCGATNTILTKVAIS